MGCGEWQLDFAATMSALLGVPFPYGRSVKYAVKSKSCISMLGLSCLDIFSISSAMGHS